MKKTDVMKHLGIVGSLAALAVFFAGYQVVASFIMIPVILALSFSPSKSGILFLLALTISMSTAGFLIDYPFHKFPAAFISLLVITITMQLRSWFFSQMNLYKVLPLEATLINLAVAGFIIGGILIPYTWQQWVGVGPIMLLYAWFSVIIYKDRAQARDMVAKNNVAPGKAAPDFTLNDQNGNPVTLKDILKTQHALLIFVRGDWCPTCHMMLRGYVKNKDVLAQKNVRIVGIGPDPVGVNKEIMSRIDENSLMLSDDEQSVAGLYSNAIQANNPVTQKLYKNGIPLPASFLVHQSGQIIYTSRSDKAAEILQPDKIFEVLATM